MKKLIIAVASALGFAFYANAAAEATIGSTFTAEGLEAGPLNIAEDEDGDGSTAGALYWTADGATEDSTVTLYDDEKNVKPTGDYVNADVGDKFLAVDQSDVLNRHFLSQDANNGSVDIGNGLYIDTMVQFTAADTAPEVTQDVDKLIVWLQEVEAADATDEKPAVDPATNLVVTAGYYNNGVLERKDYVISNKEVNPNEWYRLTIRAIPDIGNGTAGFIVYINENYVAVGKESFGITVGGAETALIEAGAVFPSLVGSDLIAAQTLTSVGLKGTGKIDNLSLSDVNPDFIVLNNNYTVTWDEGVVSFKYKIGDGAESERISTAEKENYLIELGTGWPTITFTEIVYDSANGYEAYGDIIANKAIATGADKNNCTIGAVQKLFAVGNSKYATIADAIVNANGNTIKLNTDIVVSSGDDVLPITDNIVLDLAGKKIRSTGEFSPVSLENGATLTVIDSVGTGEIIGGDNGSIYMGVDGGHVKIGLADPTSDGITDKGATICGEINTNEPDGVAPYSISVVQGKMDWDPTVYVDSGSTVTGPEDDLWTVALKGDEPSDVYVAQIGEEKYETLAEAIAAATNDGVETRVILLADVTVAELLTVAEGDVIDFNGNTFTGALAGTFEVNGGKYSTGVKNIIAPAPEKAPYNTTDAVITMSNWQTVEMPDGWATTDSVYTATELTINSGTLTLGESTYTVPGQTLTVEEGATFVVPADLAIYFVGSAVINGTITQNGTIVLAAANATIKAEEGLTVTTNVADMKVDYSDGVYTLVANSGDITWEDVDEISDVVLPGELIAESVNLQKLKDYAEANGLTVAAVATMDPVKFALGLAQSATDPQVDAAKKAFKVTISFDADGNPDVDIEGDDNFNVTPVVQGAVEVNGEYTDGVDDFVDGKKKQFFKGVIKFNAIQD